LHSKAQKSRIAEEILHDFVVGITKFQEFAFDCRKKVQRLQKRHKTESKRPSMSFLGHR